jgi:hypothetical protein
MEKPVIRKFKSWDEVPRNDLDFWLTKTPAERLEAHGQMVAFARKIYLANPKNPRYPDGRSVLKFHSSAERGRN